MRFTFAAAEAVKSLAESTLEGKALGLIPDTSKPFITRACQSINVCCLRSGFAAGVENAPGEDGYPC